MVTPDEQRSLQLDNAKQDAGQWEAIRDLNASTAADHEQLAAKVNDTIAKGKAQAAEADAEVKAAQARIEAIERGENVPGGLSKPEDFDTSLIKAGFTKADLRHFALVASIPEEHWKEFLQEGHRLRAKIDRRLTARAARTVLRKAP